MLICNITYWLYIYVYIDRQIEIYELLKLKIPKFPREPYVFLILRNDLKASYPVYQRTVQIIIKKMVLNVTFDFPLQNQQKIRNNVVWSHKEHPSARATTTCRFLPLFFNSKKEGAERAKGDQLACALRVPYDAHPCWKRRGGGGQIQVRKVLQRVYLFFHLVLSLAFRLTIILNSCIVWAQTTLYSTTCLRRILGFILGDFVLFSLPTLPVCGTVCSRGIETSPDSNFSIGGTICVRRMWLSAE